MEELVARVLGTGVAVKLAHWGEDSYASHVAFGEFYDGLDDKLDAIVEVYQGAHDKIGRVAVKQVKPDDMIEHLGDEASWIESNAEKIADKCRAVENLLDDLAAHYWRAYYKLCNLS